MLRCTQGKNSKTQSGQNVSFDFDAAPRVQKWDVCFIFVRSLSALTFLITVRGFYGNRNYLKYTKLAYGNILFRHDAASLGTHIH